MTDFSKLEWQCNRACHEWWLNLMGRSKRGDDGKFIRNPDKSVKDFDADGAEPNRADRAALRRLARDTEIDLVDAWPINSFRNLDSRVAKLATAAGWQLGEERRFRLVACAASAMAHVNDLPKIPKSMPWLLAGPEEDRVKKDYKPPFAEVRIKRLLRAKEPEDLLQQMLRAVAILKREAPPGDIGASILLWDFMPSVKRRWARDYWQAAMPLPEDETQKPETRDHAA